MIQRISPEQAKELIQKNKDNSEFQIIDIRTPAEFSQGHIPNSVNIDLFSPDFKQMISGLDKSKTYLFYCASGNRSSHVLGFLEQLGFENVFELICGFNCFEE